MISRLPRLGPPYFACSGTAAPGTPANRGRRAREHDGGPSSYGPAGRSHSAQRLVAHAHRGRIPPAGNLLRNTAHPEVVSGGAVVGIALAKFADRPGAKNRNPGGGGGGKLRRAKLIGGHYSAWPASASKPPRITRRSNVLRGQIAIHYYKNENFRHLFKYLRHEHLLAANICQAASHQGCAANKIKRWFRVAAADDIAGPNII